MSRSTRDLRELICMSRLSYHGDDDNVNSFLVSNHVDSKVYTNPVPKETKTTEQLSSKKLSTKFLPQVSPPVSPESSGRGSPLPAIHKSRSASECSSPVSSGSSSPSSPNGSDSKDKISTKQPLKPISSMKGKYTTAMPRENIHSLLIYFDATVISDWLTRSNKTVESLTAWLHSENNFVRFANFWLIEVSLSKRFELIAMEFSIIMDELKFAFGVGIQDKKLTVQDISSFMSSVLWEYPKKFSSSDSGSFFLNLLMCLCCGRKENFKALLSDVRCSTSNKQFVQFVLATRAFALVSLCSGVIDFYRQIHGLETTTNHKEVPSLSKDINAFATDFAFQAIQKGLVEVFEYLMLNYELTEKKADGKNFLFTAILCNKEKILRKLLKIQPDLDVNKKSLSSGNTPLHAAVNTGNTSIIKILVEAGANVNSWNGECEGAAPLHWAVITGNKEVVSLLLSLGCDPTVKMGIPASVTPLALAKDLGLDEIVSLLEGVKISG